MGCQSFLGRADATFRVGSQSFLGTGGRGIGVRLTAAYEHGREAGRNIVLHKPVKEGGARGAF